MAWRVTATDSFRDPWIAGRPLRVTVSGQALRDAPELCAELLSLSKSDHLAIDVSPYGHAKERPGVALLSYDHSEGSNWIVRRSSAPDEQRWLSADPAMLEGIAASVSEREGSPFEQARQLAVDLSAHRELENDFFVVTSAYALDHRADENVGLFSPAGLVSPREARRLIGTFLRARDDFRVGDNCIVDATLFYGALARGLLPTTVAAYRHCLAAARREKLERAAGHLEGIVVRVDHLAQSADHLTVLAQHEARYSAGNSVLDRQLYLPFRTSGDRFTSPILLHARR